MDRHKIRKIIEKICINIFWWSSRFMEENCNWLGSRLSDKYPLSDPLHTSYTNWHIYTETPLIQHIKDSCFKKHMWLFYTLRHNKFCHLMCMHYTIHVYVVCFPIIDILSMAVIWKLSLYTSNKTRKFLRKSQIFLFFLFCIL